MKPIFNLSAISAVLLTSTHAAVTTDNVTGPFVETNGNTNTRTLSNFTVGSGTNRLLTVFVAGEGLTSVSSVTYGGVALTQAAFGTTTTGTVDAAAIWYLLNPATGSGNIVANTTNSGSGWHLSAASFSDVAQQAPTTMTNFNNNPSNISTTFSQALGDGIIVDAFDRNNDQATITPGSGQTTIFADGANSANGGYTVGASYQIGDFAANKTVSWSTTANSEWGQAAAFFAAVPEPTTALLAALGGLFLLRRHR